MSSDYHERLITIYALTDPGGEVRYVGKAVHLQRRYARHLRDAGSLACWRGRWVKSLLDQGQRPGLLVLEECGEPAWAEAERRWIAHYRALGARLTNSCDGGDGMLNPSEEVREKMSRAGKGRPKSEEHRKKIGAAQVGKVIPAEAREKMRAAALGRKMSDAACAKMSAQRLGRKLPPGTGTKSGAARAKTYVLLSPEGELITVSHLSAFCREHGIVRGNLLACSKKGRPSEGWFVPSEAYPAPRPSRQGQRP